MEVSNGFLDPWYRLRTALRRREQSNKIYFPLDKTKKEIRILKLKSGSFKDPLKGKLIRKSLLDSATTYETVSYCWGPPNLSAEIHIDGRRLPVTENAFGALRNLRLPYRSRYVWIDAICIDQSNQEERGHQVGIMADVYKAADRTVVWLGEDDGTMAQAAEGIHILAEEMNAKTDQFTYRKMEGMMMKFEAVRDSAAWPDIADKESIFRFYARPWFTRLWVVQEVVLSKDCVFVSGSVSLTWHDVSVAAAWLRHAVVHRPGHRVPSKTIDGIRNTGKIWLELDPRGYLLDAPHYNPVPRLSEVLFSTVGFFVADPKDRVYAVLGLTRWAWKDESYPSHLQPDYTKSVCTIYRDSTIAAIHEGGYVHILSYVWVTESSINSTDCPSWVPRWDLGKHGGDRGRFRWSHYTLWREFGLQPDAVQSPDILVAPGFELDYIKTTSAVVKAGSLYADSRDAAKTLQSLWEIACLSEKYSKEGLLRAFSIALVAGLYHGRPAHQDSTHDPNFAAYQARTGWYPRDDDLPPRPDFANGHWQAFERELRRTLDSRRLFVTSKGYIGIGTRHAQEGDLVCVLYGGIMPKILRKAGSTFAFLGDCYIQGVMFADEAERQRVRNEGKAYEQHFNIY